jgi:hypothetical protein
MSPDPQPPLGAQPSPGAPGVPGIPATPAPAPPASTAGERTVSMTEKIDEIHRRVVLERTTELSGLLEILGHRRRLMWLNFSAGLARGVGFFLGVTLIGALILGGIALAFNAAVGYMGFKDITLEQAVKATVAKFNEIEKLVGEAKEEVHTEAVQRAEMERLAPLEPDPAVQEDVLPR